MQFRRYPFRAVSSYSQAPIKAPLRYNDFGYTIGGPIWIPGVFNRNRDKLFFFAAQEYKRLRTSTVTNATVPTPAAIADAIRHWTVNCNRSRSRRHFADRPEW